MPQEYHNSKGKKSYWRARDNVMIYNVPKSLIKPIGKSYSVGFKYDESDDGYAHFGISDEELFESKNDKFYHVIMNTHDSKILNYKHNGKEVGKEIYPKDLKTLFEKVRVSSRPSKKYTESREVPDIENLAEGTANFTLDSIFD